jgi:MoxR-like ATPase
LIDEIDRADDEFDAFLLELLSDFQVTIPEIGTIRAKRRPVVIMTSNRTRELHDALKRRCLYHWIDHPTPERETAIVRARVEGASERLARQASRFVASLRELQLSRTPGVAETIDWVGALAALEEEALRPDAVEATLGAVLKEREDFERVRGSNLAAIVAAAAAAD